MSCMCNEISKLESDKSKLESIVRDLNGIYSDFNMKYSNRKTEIKDFFAASGAGYYFRVNELQTLNNNVDEYKKTLPKDFSDMISDIEGSIADVARRLRNYYAWDEAYHRKQNESD